MTSDGLVNLFEWIQTVRPEQLPEAPFSTAPGQTVCDGAGWLRAVQRDAILGNESPRARWGALQEDLRWIYNHIKGMGSGT